MTENYSIQAAEKTVNVEKTPEENSLNPNTELRISPNSSSRHPLRSILKARIATKHGRKVNTNMDDKLNGEKKTAKKKRRDKSDLGDDFVAPDGGWGWLVAIAAGVHYLVMLAVSQNFGIIFRAHMLSLGINTAQLTTIINIKLAVSAFTGLLNGPLFRRFTFRQVAIVGSLLTFIGILFSAFANSFMAYVLAFSCCYGLGHGLTISASSLAVYTYFKAHRRTAIAYKCGVAGLGPIIFPYIATYMLYYFDVQGIVLIFSALSLNAFACSLIYQPVMWHIKKSRIDPEAPNYLQEEKANGIFEPDTPLFPRANDGWYDSRLSFNSVNDIRLRSSTLDSQMQELKPVNNREYLNIKGVSNSIEQSIIEKVNSDEELGEESLKLLNNQEGKQQKVSNASKIDFTDDQENLKSKSLENLHRDYELEDKERKRLPFYKKIIIFFDFDLLHDFGYLNLAFGITLITFVEVNFTILIPFILSDFGFNDNQIAVAMSSLGFCDLVVRFSVPLLARKINFSNKTFYMIGIVGMCFGRLLLAFTRNFYAMEAIFIWLGLNKAFRSVFWSLIIPGYVPLKRLPAAAGLQLLMSGLAFLICGPLIGLIRDHTSYGFVLQFLNILCISTIVMWLVKDTCRKSRSKKEQGFGDAKN